jgi:hypothetical protein
VGIVAAFGGLLASLGTDTSEFSHRLKKKSAQEDVETLTRVETTGDPGEVSLSKGITSKQFHRLAYRMAAKSLEDDPSQNFSKPRSRPGIAAIRDKVARKKAKGGRAYQITSATAHYVNDLTVTGLKGEFPKNT